MAGAFQSASVNSSAWLCGGEILLEQGETVFFTKCGDEPTRESASRGVSDGGSPFVYFLPFLALNSLTYFSGLELNSSRQPLQQT